MSKNFLEHAVLDSVKY